MMHDDIDDAFWAEGAGAMSLRTIRERDGSLHRAIVVLLPNLVHTKYAASPTWLYLSHAAGNWAKPGPVNGWDGNELEPTLSPSVHVPVLGWHGFIEKGKLRQV